MNYLSKAEVVTVLSINWNLRPIHDSSDQLEKDITNLGPSRIPLQLEVYGWISMGNSAIQYVYHICNIYLTFIYIECIYHMYVYIYKYSRNLNVNATVPVSSLVYKVPSNHLTRSIRILSCTYGWICRASRVWNRSGTLRNHSYLYEYLWPKSQTESTYTYPPKMNESPLKSDHFKWKFHLPTINFQGIC